MHRARWLAKELPAGERILFTTFTRNLAADIRNNLRAICTPEEMERIEVINLDQWVQRFLRGKRYRFRLTFGREREAWRKALAEKPGDLTFSDALLQRRVGTSDPSQWRNDARGLPAHPSNRSRYTAQPCRAGQDLEGVRRVPCATRGTRHHGGLRLLPCRRRAFLKMTVLVLAQSSRPSSSMRRKTWLHQLGG